MELINILKYYNSSDWEVIELNKSKDNSNHILSECKCKICSETQLIRKDSLNKHRNICTNCNNIFIKNFINCTYDRLTFTDIYKDNIVHKYYCKYRCSCGNTGCTQLTNIIFGGTKSCGCKDAERKVKHNLTNSRLYTIYTNMNQRCYNINNDAYNDYGGRGIYIYDEWLNKDNGFMNFYNWSINNGYDNSLTIDRINNDGPYTPWNCRWVTQKIQCNNKRNNVIIPEIGYTITETSKLFGINTKTFIQRYKRNNNDLIKSLLQSGIKPGPMVIFEEENKNVKSITKN